MHPLDTPIWSALASRQAPFDRDGVRARRFPVAVSPLAAMQDHAPESAEALAARIPAADDIAMLERIVPSPPTGVEASVGGVCLQMLLQDGFKGGASSTPLVALGDADAAEMLALALLTKPGPFRARTHTMGRFMGVRAGGELVAMAGERLHVDGFHEISAVCTHPDHRGKGYGAALMRAIGERMRDEGDTPFLHCYDTNTGAVALYLALGFTVRTALTHVIWRRL